MNWKHFLAGAVAAHAINTGLVMYVYVAIHPDDNFIRAAIEWPWRLIVIGYNAHQCSVC